MGGQRHVPAVLSLGTHCIRGWYGLSARLFEYEEEKILPLTGFEPRNLQRVVSRYTDRAVPALDIMKFLEYLW